MRSLLRATILFFALSAPLTGLLGQSVRVLVATGEVTLQAPGETAPRPAVKGDVVPLGSRLVTGPGARLVLTPFPGITSMLAENSTLVVERAESSTPPGTTATLQQATLDLKTGAIVSDLEKQAGIAYDYSVKTPRGVAGARGTIYAVAIHVSGVESVLVSDGTIQITFTDATSLTLSPGQASLTRPGQPSADVTRLSDLSPSEQTILQAVMETTLETLAAAIEAGVDLQPDALQLTLQFALDFGFEIDAELLASLQAALAAEDADDLGGMLDQVNDTTNNTTDTDSTNVVTETGETTTPTDPITPPDDAETTFANSLSPTRKAAFLRRPSDIRSKLLQLNDNDYTNLALDPDPVTGIELTDTQLRDGLENLAYLKVHDPDAFEFLKAVSGGTGLPGADTAPSPTDHSLSAFALMGQTWSALSPEDQATLAAFGAGDSIMNTSAGYLTELLNQVDTLTTEQKTALTETGWGAYLTTIAGDSSLQAAVDTVAAYTPEQRATIQAFGLSPYAFVNPNQSAGFQTASLPFGDPVALLDALSRLSAADKTILRRLDLEDNLLNYRSGYSSDGETYIPLTIAERLDLTVDFYKALTPAEQTLLLSIDAGHWLFENAPDEYIDSQNQGLALTRNILAQVAGLSTDHKEAAFTLGLLDGVSLNDDRLTTPILTQALERYLAAPAHVQRFLRDEFGGAAILDVTVGSHSESTVRSLADITTILSSLTTDELDTLRDMEIGETLVQDRFFLADFENSGDLDTLAAINTPPTAGQQLKAMVNFYDTLPAAQQQTLTELGILGTTRDNFATFLADFDGLRSLLQAYAALPAKLRAETQRLPGSDSYQNYQGRSFFVPRASNFNSGSELYYVTFTSPDDLYVGATRVLRVTSGSISPTDTFISTGEDPAGYSLYLRAADLIELTDVRFSHNIRSISMSAVTLNLYNIAFNDGTRIALNSKLGGTDANGSGSGPYPTFEQGSVYGRVNFNNVTYGGHLLNGASAFDTYGINIKLGTLQNPALPPTSALPLPNNNDTLQSP